MATDSWEWTEADLLRLVHTSEQESLTLDYKACDALQNTDGKKNELSKDISALANSAGGTIIYGIQEVGHVAVALDTGFDLNVTTKEWLEQVINSRIQRKIDGIRINPIELASTNPGHYAFAVYVPQSLRAPHQASDKRFYKRYNFESVAMEEYEIRDVARRLRSPLLRLEVDISGITSQLTCYPDFKITNDSPAIALYAVVNIFLDTALLRRSTGYFDATGPASTISIHGVDRQVMRCQRWWKVPNDMPLFEGAEYPLGQVYLQLSSGAELNNEHALAWQIQAPDFTSDLYRYAITWKTDSPLLSKID